MAQIGEVFKSSNAVAALLRGQGEIEPGSGEIGLRLDNAFKQRTRRLRAAGGQMVKRGGVVGGHGERKGSGGFGGRADG